jgi:hypothetical protein
MDLSLGEKILIGSGLGIVAIVGLIALYAPPNTWDSMTYHLARVAHWIQNSSVELYPTAIPRQLVFSPYAEYAILHSVVLTASDRFATMVQWSSMVGAAVGVSLIAKMLGANRFSQILSALFVLTLPMGILQGSSTQNDFVVTLWLVCAGVFFLQIMGSWSKRRVALAAAALGLVALTKGTGFVIGLSLILVWLFFARQTFRRKFGVLSMVVLSAVILTGAFYVRMKALDSNPFNAYRLAGSVALDRVTPAAVASNVIRNLATQLALPWVAWNRAEEAALKVIHRGIGIDVSDPSTTDGTFLLWYFLDEDYVTNFPQAVLILIAAVLFWFVRPKTRQIWCWAATVALGFLFFCATVKWQPWISRFHLPLFVLAAPLAVVVLARFWSKKTFFVVMAVLLLTSIPALLWNNSRRIVSAKSIFLSSRSALYFSKKPVERDVYRKATDTLTTMGCHEIGLKIGLDTWEYPWWVLMGWPREPLRVEHLAVDNVSSHFPFSRGEFHPCAIIVESREALPSVLLDGNRAYGRLLKSPILTVYWDLTRPQQRL